MSDTSRVSCLVREIGSGEYPDLDKSFLIWDRLRGDRLAPARADFIPEDFVAVLPRMMLADVVREGGELDFRYRLSGTGICDVHGADPTNMSAKDFKPPSYAAMIHQHYTEAVHTARPVLHLIMLDTSIKSRCYARLLLPLSDDGANVTMLMAIDSEKQNTRELRRYFEQNPMRTDFA